MKKVLIISYYFPPASNIGGLRIHGLAKYLPYFGWEPIILTKNSPGNFVSKYYIIKTHFFEYDSITTFKQKIGINSEQTIKEKLQKADLKNKKTLLDMLINFAAEVITYPDNQKSWYSQAFELGDKILNEEHIDAVISSSSPTVSHIIAHDLKEKHNIPWIADFRDLWTQNHYYSYSNVRKFFEKRLELKTLAASSALTTVSKDLAFDLEILHKGMPVYSIPNGFDLDELANLTVNLTYKFVITYTGSLYQGKRDPSKLFQALQELIEEHIIDREFIEVRFYGPEEDWMKNEIQKYNLQGIVYECGLVSRDVALLKQRESQLLLLLLWDHPSEVGVYTGKLFEYIASKRPILAIGGPKGVVSELLEETKTGFFVSSLDEIKNTIRKYYNEYMSNGQLSYQGDILKIEKYSQKEMARKFAETLDKISNK